MASNTTSRLIDYIREHGPCTTVIAMRGIGCALAPMQVVGMLTKASRDVPELRQSLFNNQWEVRKSVPSVQRIESLMNFRPLEIMTKPVMREGALSYRAQAGWMGS